MALHHAAKNKQITAAIHWQLTTPRVHLRRLVYLFFFWFLLHYFSCQPPTKGKALSINFLAAFPSLNLHSLGVWVHGDPKGERVMNRIARGDSITTWAHGAALMRKLEQVNSAFFPPRRPLSCARYSRSRGERGPLVRPIRESFMPWLSLPLIPNILNIRSSPSLMDLSFPSQK